jgi:hypothetical protein
MKKKIQRRKFNPKQSVIAILSAKVVFQVGTFLSLVFFIYQSVEANLTARIGGHVLFMDERIIFDGVQTILYPDSWTQFIDAIINGGDQRYGRILYNLSAFVSFIPEKIYGEQGQIFATRMLSTSLIVISALLFTIGLNAIHYMKFVITNIFLFVPFSSYYTTMPKPEPLAMFTFSLYFFLYKSNSIFGRKLQYLLIGIMVGVKVSMAPIAIALLILEIKKSTRDKVEIRRLLILTLVGLSFAVPTLLPFSLGALVVEYFLEKSTLRNYNISNLNWGCLQLFFQTFIYFSLLRFANLEPIRNWLAWTVLGTTHPADSPNISWRSWINYFLQDWSGSSHFSLLIIFFFLIFVTLMILNAKHLLNFLRKNPGENLLVSVGLLSILTIFFFVHRLWGMYLYVGAVIFLIGLISTTFSYLKQIYPSQIIAKNLVLVILYCEIAFSMMSFSSDISQIKAREFSAAYQTQLRDFNFFSSQVLVEDRNNISILYDPQLFVPVKNSRIQIDRFWGPLIQFGSYDYVVIGKSHVPHYSTDAKERKSFQNHVSDLGSTCEVKPCYTILGELPSGGLILKRDFN